MCYKLKLIFKYPSFFAMGREICISNAEINKVYNLYFSLTG